MPKRFMREIEDKAKDLIRKGWPNDQARRELDRLFPRRPLPSLRTLARYRRDVVPVDPSGPWNPDTGTDDNQLALVTPLLAGVILGSEGQRRVTNAEAEWITFIRVIAPDLNHSAVYVLAREFLVRTEQGRSTDDLNGFLAFAPWRSPENAQHYFDGAVYSGWVPPPPGFLYELVPSDFCVERPVIMAVGEMPPGVSPKKIMEGLAKARKVKHGTQE
jgi:hypothetical protein